jgi:predicted secreted protein with PEFG-CTERM motif
MNKKIMTFFFFTVVFLGFSGCDVVSIPLAFAEDNHGDNQDSANRQSRGEHQDNQINGEQNHTRLDYQNESQNRTMPEYHGENKTMFENHGDNKNMSENESDNRTMSESHDENKTISESVEGDRHGEHHNSVFTPTQQDIQNINQAKVNQTIAAEVNVGTNQSTTSIDSNVSVQTTSNTPDSLNVNVSAPSQTGPKVIVFNLNATTVNLQNLNNLGVMYDGKLIQPAPNMDAILHAKSTDSPSFAIVVTQSGIQVLVLVPHFSTHSITIMNMSQVIAPTVPEFPFAAIVLVIATFSIVLLSRMKQYRI